MAKVAAVDKEAMGVNNNNSLMEVIMVVLAVVKGAMVQITHRVRKVEDTIR